MAGISRKYRLLRRSHAMWVSRRVWQPRLVFWAGAVSIGLISVLFALLADRAAGLLSMVSGIPGGLFAPSLAVGAGLGSTLGLVFGTATGTAALLGMAGYFAGVVQAPMTAFVIILEMTGNHDNVIALMCAAMLGYGTARLISNEPLYHALSRVFIAEAIRRRRAETMPAPG